MRRITWRQMTTVGSVLVMMMMRSDWAMQLVRDSQRPANVTGSFLFFHLIKFFFNLRIFITVCDSAQEMCSEGAVVIVVDVTRLPIRRVVTVRQLDLPVELALQSILLQCLPHVLLVFVILGAALVYHGQRQIQQ